MVWAMGWAMDMEVMAWVALEAMVAMDCSVNVVYQKCQTAWNVSLCLAPTNSIATSNYFKLFLNHLELFLLKLL